MLAEAHWVDGTAVPLPPLLPEQRSVCQEFKVHKEKWQVMCRRNRIKSDLVGGFEDTSLKLLSLFHLLVKSSPAEI